MCVCWWCSLRRVNVLSTVGKPVNCQIFANYVLIHPINLYSMGVLLNWWREILLTALSAGASNFSSMSVCGRRIPRSRILSRRPVSRCSARGPYVCYNLHRGTCDWKKKRPEPVHQRINLFQVLHLLYAKLRSSVNAPVHRITSTL